MPNMILTPDTNICTLSHLSNFGEFKITGNHRNDSYIDYGVCAKSFESFVSQLNELIRAFDNNSNYGISKRALVSAYTTSRQPVAEKYLAELGFTGIESGDFPKYDHICTMWVMPSPEFAKRVKELTKEFAKKAEKPSQ